MYVSEESDSGVEPMNHLNQGGQPPAESEEGRPLVKENTHPPHTRPTQCGERVSPGLMGVRLAEHRFAAIYPRQELYALISARTDPCGGCRVTGIPTATEPLLAIADLAGGGWPEAAKKALVELCAGAQADDDSVGVSLLRDIKAAFAEKHVTEMPSADLAAALAEVEGSPWGEWSKGKPLSQSKLARLLKPFDVRPDRIGGKDSRLRGYAVEWFNDAFSRYLPRESVHPSTTRENSGDYEDLKASTIEAVDTSENAVSPAENADCGHVDTFKYGYREQANAEPDVLEL
jgi:hypothetical protein